MLSPQGKEGKNMSWKRYKKIFSSLKTPFDDETKFILGLDIGNQTSVISYWNVNRKEPEWIDISGGYGKPSIPTVMQYVPEHKEWVYGEYAVLNQGFFEDITITYPVKRLGYGEWIDIDGKPMNLPLLLSRYLKELVEMCRNINPNGEIAGMVVATPTYFSDEAKEEFYRAFSLAGLEQQLICFLPHRECILHSLYHQEMLQEEEKILYIDYGMESLRSGIFHTYTQKEEMKGEVLSSLFDFSLGLQNFEEKLRRFFIELYCEETQEQPDQLTRETIQQIEILLYHNKAMLLQQYFQGKSMKLYFNFVHPAFQKTIEKGQLEKIIKPFQEQIEEFLKKALNKTMTEPLLPHQITKVVLSGGGFEMDWALQTIKDKFPHIPMIYDSFSEGQISHGACWAAASYLGLAAPLDIQLEDQHRLTVDLGIKIETKKGDQFIPFVEKKSFWWHDYETISFITQHEEEEELTLHWYQRNGKGEESYLGEVVLDNLPTRPRGATRIDISYWMDNPYKLSGIIKDRGFGEFFPATDYEKKFEVIL